MSRRERSKRRIDWLTFSTYLGLIVIGLLMIYSAEYDPDISAPLLSTSAGKQAIWLVMSLILMGVVFVLDWKLWQVLSYPIYFFTLISLIAVLLFGTTIKGATSWFTFGSVSIQPSEFAKFGTALAIAAFLSSYNTDLSKLRFQFFGFLLFLLPATLILLQPDAGSALVFFSFLITFYRAGLSGAYYIIGGFTLTTLLLGIIYSPLLLLAALLILANIILVLNIRKNRLFWFASIGLASLAGILLFLDGWEVPILIGFSAILGALYVFQWMQSGPRLIGLMSLMIGLGTALSFGANFAFNNILKPHQQERINVWLRPQECDPQGALYNVLQSKMAISSGGWMGSGYLKGKITQLNYVPEQSTDFIFCTIGEQQGFVGSFIIIGLFLVLLFRIITIAERQRSNFSRYYAYGVAGILFLHFFINIGMTMGLAPIIGIPLPFLSKGGSSLLGFTLLMSVLLHLDRNRFRI